MPSEPNPPFVAERAGMQVHHSGPPRKGGAVRRDILIIVNPAAGRRRAAERRLARYVAALEHLGCRVTLRRADPSMGEIEHLASEAEPGLDAIIAAGGDGTINAIVNGIGSRRIPIGVLPLGTANVLARDIGLPREPGRLAAVIANAPANPVWPGRAGGRTFMAMASAGFDSEIVASVDPVLKQRSGRLAFVWSFLRRLCRYRHEELSVTADGLEYRAVSVIVAKTRYYAGPFIVAPNAKLSEAAIELVLFHSAGRLAILRYALALFLGLLPRLHDVRILRAREVRLSAARSLPVQADGEIVDQLPVTIAIADRPLFLIQPQA